MGIQSMESRRSLFPDIYPNNDNYPLYQSFLKHYKLGLILNEVFRLKYYDTLFPAMETMRDTLSGMPPPGNQTQSESASATLAQSHIDYSMQSNKVKSGSPQILASTIGSAATDQTEAAQEMEASDEEQEVAAAEEGEEEEESDSDEYEYEYEYEYENEYEDEYDDDDDSSDEENQGVDRDVGRK
eukprot:CAMPEP_0197025352 /NCGR_PEP_ID=MMETSP1384-20130603/5724_1 /TAXON_ID=29189 /ORGANISM="Ammonia sp." /LENGTH=184 /DNA_ID=CAMNT_0042453879 /DNA_START=153 /DNA_END=707 /DNA_ORIENTATION=+